MRFQWALLFSVALGCHGSGGEGSLAGGGAAAPGPIAPVRLGAAFEGEIVEEAGQGVRFVYEFKASKVRLTIADHGKEVWSLYLPNEGRIYQIDDDKKEIVGKRLAGSMQPNTPGVDLKPGGDDSVAGVPCEVVTGIYVAQQTVMEFRVCAVRGLHYAGPLAFIAESPLEARMRVDRMFPLRYELRRVDLAKLDQARPPFDVIQASAVTQKPMPAERFELPDNYHVTDWDQVNAALEKFVAPTDGGRPKP